MAELNGRPLRVRPTPEFPESLGYLWAWFLELSMGMGEMLTWTVLQSWASHMETSPEPRDCLALFSIDRAYRNPDPEKRVVQ